MKLGNFKPLHRSSTSPKRPFQTASLEDEIGALIFIRDSSVLKLAPTGTELFDYSERMLELQHQVMQLGKSKKEMLGAVRIGVISSQRDCNRKPRRRQKSHLCDICWRDDGARLQIKTAAEVFADSAYEENGHLLNRKIPGAVLHNPLEAAEHIDTIFCAHSDTPGAIAMAAEVRSMLEANGIRDSPFSILEA